MAKKQLVKVPKKTTTKKEELDTLNLEARTLVVSELHHKIKELDWEIAKRNAYMEKRDRVLYDPEAIFEDLDIKAGFDKTQYNFLPRAKEIHTMQVMGGGFNIITRYDKEDTSLYQDGTPEKQAAELANKKAAIQASNGKDLLDGVVNDNGGNGLFLNMAAVASGFGTGIIKKWIDTDTNMVKLVSIESVENFRAGWSANNFRERDFDAITYQISVDQATRLYGDKLLPGEKFSFDEGMDMQVRFIKQTSRKMVTCIDWVGRHPDINNGEPFHALVIGGFLAGYDTKAKFFPKYYLFPNREQIRRPWGASDITDQAIDLNKSYIQKMSDYTSLINKILFPMIAARGFEDVSLPKKEQREVQVFPMSLEQDMHILQFNPMTYPYQSILSETKEALFRVLGLGRVMIDDPTVSFHSNQALLTGMKSTIDIAEEKQRRWERTFVEMFEDILQDLYTLDPKIKDLVGNVTLDIEWPSVLRKEDATYSTMLLNNVRGGLISLETYLEKIGIQNVAEEIDRIKVNMNDPVVGAILSANLRTVNQMELQDLMQEQQAQQQASQQPPQQPGQMGGPQPTGAPLTPDQNNQQTQPMSQPGSGAPAVSSAGAMNTLGQNVGR